MKAGDVHGPVHFLYSCLCKGSVRTVTYHSRPHGCLCRDNIVCVLRLLVQCTHIPGLRVSIVVVLAVTDLVLVNDLWLFVIIKTGYYITLMCIIYICICTFLLDMVVLGFFQWMSVYPSSSQFHQSLPPFLPLHHPLPFHF